MTEVTTVLALLVAVVALVTLARKIDVPYPILLVVGGLALGLLPGLPAIQLSPNLVFVLFLPPLLYQEALTVSYRDFRANLPSITLLATGLVAATTCLVALVAHRATAATSDPLSWPLCFVLGAIVAPTDAVAATAIFQRLGVPRRLRVVLEGESLVNDATALILFTTALGVATQTGVTFSPALTALRFVAVVVGSIAIGALVGRAIAALHRRLNDPPVENTVSLLAGFAAYLPAYVLGLSGVLAVVTAGVYQGRVDPRIVSSRTRLQAEEMWEVIVFLLNGLIFILIGLQLRTLIERLSPALVGTYVWVTVLVSATVVVVRLAWMFPSARLARLVTPPSRRQPNAPWRSVVVAGWAGMGGVVSLAAALALPDPKGVGAADYTASARGLIVFIAFGVILATLVGKGLTLPWLIRRLGLADDGIDAREETKARYKASQAALAQLETLAAEDGIPLNKLEYLRSHYQHRSHVLASQIHGHDDEGHDHVSEASAYQRLRRETLLAERQTVVRLRDDGVINDDVLHRIQRELDLEDIQLGEEAAT
jgi:CPA1 family monovalent cation:H+ antiporter